MNGIEFREIRKRLGLSEAEFAEELGYTGNERNNVTAIQRYERGKRQVPLYMARLAWLLDQINSLTPIEKWTGFERFDLKSDDGVDIGRGSRWLPEWPEWTGYEFKSVPDVEHEEGSPA